MKAESSCAVSFLSSHRLLLLGVSEISSVTGWFRTRRRQGEYRGLDAMRGRDMNRVRGLQRLPSDMCCRSCEGIVSII